MGSDIVFYVDGVAHKAVHETSNLPLSIMRAPDEATGQLGIGGSGGDRGPTFGGLIDELAIYKGALSEAEISTLLRAADTEHQEVGSEAIAR